MIKPRDSTNLERPPDATALRLGDGLRTSSPGKTSDLAAGALGIMLFLTFSPLSAQEDSVASAEPPPAAVEEASALTDAEIRERFAKLEASEAEPAARKVFRDWGAFAVAVFALLLGLFNSYQSHQSTLKEREIEAKRLLDQAWDLLGGRPGIELISSYVTDRSVQEQARRLIRDAVELAPNLSLAYRRMGNYHQARGDLVEAEVGFRRALVLDPDCIDAHIHLGNNLSVQSRLEESEASYRRAIKLDPGDALAHNNLGNILLDQDRLKESEASFRRATKLDPGHTLALNNLGVTLRVQGRLEESEASFRRALEVDPNYAVAHTNLGNTLSDQGRLEETEASYRRAFELDPDNETIRQNLQDFLDEKDSPDG